SWSRLSRTSVAVFGLLLVCAAAFAADKPAKSKPVNIDLRKYEKPLVKFINDSIGEFVKAHPGAEISAIALSGTGFHCDVAIHFDTTANSDKFVKKYDKDSGKDQAGTFCNSTEDFAFARQAEFTLPGYPKFYDIDDKTPVTFTGLDGKSKQIDSGDEA